TSDERRSAKYFQTLVSRYESGIRTPHSARRLNSSWLARGSGKKSSTPRFFRDSLLAVRRVISVELDTRADLGSHGMVPLGLSQFQGAICESDRLRKLAGLGIGLAKSIQHTRIGSRCKIVCFAGKCYSFIAVADCSVLGGGQNLRGANQSRDAVGLKSEYLVPQVKSLVLLAQSDVRTGQSLLSGSESRTESDCAFQFRQCLVRVALLQQESAQIVVTFDKLRIDVDRLAKLLERFLCVTQEIKVDS